MSEPAKTIAITEGKSKVEYKLLVSIEELKKTGQVTKWIDGHDILVYEYNGEIKALSNICRHFGGPVGYHKMRKDVFTCLWHNWQFSANDGSCLTHPGLPLRQYVVKVVDGNIYINLEG